MNVSPHHRALHSLFLLSIWIKGLAGLAETLAGIAVPFVAQETLVKLVVRFTAPELSEDPDDWAANYLSSAVRNYSVEAQSFTSAYLVIHGIIKVALVASLLWGRRLWAYTASIWFLVAFIFYQMYRFPYTHSIWLLLLTAVDLAVIYLIWREYKWRKQGL
jgi:uncharacterized membrane protein